MSRMRPALIALAIFSLGVGGLVLGYLAYGLELGPSISVPVAFMAFLAVRYYVSVTRA
jgi:hypothetical protein